MSLAADLLGSRAALEEGSRDRAHATYLGEGTALCRVLGKFLMYVDTQDMGLVPYLCLDGFWESWVTLAIARIIRPGWHCVDIGANHGYFTLLMADATGPTGRALAVEPNPRLADYARRSIEVNGLKEIGAVAQMAVSDRVGESVRLSHPTRHAHLANPFHAVEDGETVEGWETAEVWETFPAMTTTLDDLTRDWPRLDLVKIDAEGMEEVIWSGGHATWERYPGVTVVLEFNTTRYANPPAFLAAIREGGFDFAAITADGSVTCVSDERILTEHPGEDWMLFLTRPGFLTGALVSLAPEELPAPRDQNSPRAAASSASAGCHAGPYRGRLASKSSIVSVDPAIQANVIYPQLAELVRRHHSDSLVQLPRHLSGYELKVFSQNGEDGVIAEILRRIEPCTRSFIEFGVQAYEGNCVFLADVLDWSGLFIDADPVHVDLLEQKYRHHPRITTRLAQVTPESLDTLLHEASVPEEPDLLSIDVDGNDFWLWAAATHVRPRVVVIEYNARLSPHSRLVQPYIEDWKGDGSDYFGASLGALRWLGERKGYRLVHTDLTGVNAFFVREDLIDRFADMDLAAVPVHAPNFYFTGTGHRPDPQNRTYLDLDRDSRVELVCHDIVEGRFEKLGSITRVSAQQSIAKHLGQDWMVFPGHSDDSTSLRSAPNSPDLPGLPDERSGEPMDPRVARGRNDWLAGLRRQVRIPFKSPSPRIVSVTAAGNDAKLIEDALHSVISWVDWCLVIDTGVTDDTLVIARAIAGPKLVVRTFPWRDDFAAARNFALDEAAALGGDWAVMVDTDERLDLRGEVIARTLAKSSADVLQVPNDSLSYAKDRFFRLPTRGRYVGPTHECFVTLNGNVGELPSVRFAEVPKDPEAYRHKVTRDAEMLASYIEQHPEDPRWYYYLGDALQNLSHFRDAIPAYQRCAALTGWDEEAAWACYREAQCWIAVGAHDTAVERCALGLARHAGIAELAWLAAYASWTAGAFDQAVHWARISIAGGCFRGRCNDVHRWGFRHPPALWEGPYDVLRFALEEMGDVAGAVEADRLYEAAIAARETDARWRGRGLPVVSAWRKALKRMSAMVHKHSPMRVA